MKFTRRADNDNDLMTFFTTFPFNWIHSMPEHTMRNCERKMCGFQIATEQLALAKAKQWPIFRIGITRIISSLLSVNDEIINSFRAEAISIRISVWFWWFRKRILKRISGSNGYGSNRQPNNNEALGLCAACWHLHWHRFSHFFPFNILTAMNCHRMTRIAEKNPQILVRNNIRWSFMWRERQSAVERHANRFASVRALFIASERTCIHWAAANPTP